MARPSITEILRKAEQLNSPQVAKARGVARLLLIVFDVLRVLSAMQKKQSELEERIKRLESELLKQDTGRAKG